MWVVVLAVTLAGGRALGDDAKLARQHFEDGSRLYDLGKFREAAREYEEAYKLKPVPVLLFNIGQAYRGAGEVTQAINAYRSYLRKVPAAPNRADVEALLDKLEKSAEAERHPPPPAPTPAPQPEPQLTPTAPPTTAPPTTALVATPPSKEQRPLYKKWWLWTAVGGVVVVGGVVAIAVAATTPKDAASPANTFGVSLH
jgi:tetratricopeptide (TPR) repeat protein